MRSYWTHRSFSVLVAGACLAIATHSIYGQKGAPSAGGTGAGSGGFGSPTRGTGNGSVPGLGDTGTNGIGTNGRPMFLSGKVQMDDGTQPNPNIRIERVCGGTPHLETHTDAKGRFSFQVGQNLSADTDASDPSGNSRPNSQWSSNSGTGLNTANHKDPLWNFEQRAS
jgi:hypothetical protein